MEKTACRHTNSTLVLTTATCCQAHRPMHFEPSDVHGTMPVLQVCSWSYNTAAFKVMGCLWQHMGTQAPEISVIFLNFFLGREMRRRENKVVIIWKIFSLELSASYVRSKVIFDTVSRINCVDGKQGHIVSFFSSFLWPMP